MSNDQLIVLFVNRRAGSGPGTALVADLEEALIDRGFEVQVISDFAGLQESVSNPVTPRVVVAAGGDGTIEAVANFVDPSIPIAVFPLGTENLLAKYLGVEAHPRRAAEMIWHGATRHLDAVIDVLGQRGFTAERVPVNYEFQSGGNEMLRVQPVS